MTGLTTLSTTRHCRLAGLPPSRGEEEEEEKERRKEEEK